jgi:hypothetical protein
LDLASIGPSTTHLQDQLADRVHSPNNPHPRAGIACSQDLHGLVVRGAMTGFPAIQILVSPRFAVEEQDGAVAPGSAVLLCPFYRKDLTFGMPLNPQREVTTICAG